MEIASKIAGYSLSEADNFRKAIGKKKAEIMKKEKEKFIQGCIKQKYARDIAEKIFNLIEKFAGYGFNKAHSASYALIAYQTAYMKYLYPIEYMTAILTAENRATSGPIKEEKMSRLVTEVKRMAIAVLPPDINHSDVEFSIENRAIRFGLSAVKNVGEAAIDNILIARHDKQFESFFDFLARVDGQKVNKKTLESLIKAGALDAFGKRSALLLAMDEIRKDVEKKQKQDMTGQNSLFGGDEDDPNTTTKNELPDTEEFSKSELLAFEKQFLGFYLSEHPALERLLKAGENLFKLSEITLAEHVGRKMKLAGLITAVKKIFTKKDGSEMAFVTVDDMTARMELVVFPKTYALHKDKLYEDNVIIFVGKIDEKEEKINILIEEIQSA
jgi:DNA polymerase-3 subunit alpha